MLTESKLTQSLVLSFKTEVRILCIKNIYLSAANVDIKDPSQVEMDIYWLFGGLQIEPP